MNLEHKNIKTGGINVLSLCDGMSCGHIALDRAGIKINNYFASEIKDIALKVTKHNYPDTIFIGDVNKISYKDGTLYTENGNHNIEIDLVIFGSPCQSFSRAMREERRIGLEDKVRSGLFLECYRILKEVNPKWFLMENVIMKDEDKNLISEMMGVQPIRINSSLITGQLRDRLYWTNIPTTVPENKNIKLNDILNDGYCPFEKAKCLMANDSHGYYNGCNWTPIKRFYRTFYKNFGTMIFPNEESYRKCLEITDKILDGRKPRAEHFEGYEGKEFDCARYLWKEERARLQTVPEEYVGNVIGDLTSRRGRLDSQEKRGNGMKIRAYVPLAEMFGYSTDLRSRTQGRGNYVMEVDHYEPCPKSVQEKVLEGRK